MTDWSKPRVVVTKLDVSRSHKMAVLAEVHDPNNKYNIGTLTDITGGNVTLDASSAARGRFQIEMPARDTLVPRSHRDLLAPFGNEIYIYRGIEEYDHIDLVRLGIFRIDATRVSGDQLNVEGLDRSGWFIDDLFHGTAVEPTGKSKYEVIQGCIERSRSGVQMEFMVPDQKLKMDVNLHEGGNRWETCLEVAASMGAELFYDRNGVLRLRPVPLEAGLPVATISEGEGGVLLNVERAWDRAGVVNQVTVEGMWARETSTLDPPKATVSDMNPQSPTYYYGNFGRKPFWYVNPFCHEVIDCQLCAAGMLGRSIGAPDSISFGQIVDPTRSPDDVVRVNRARLGLGIEGHVIDSVEIPLSVDGVMTCNTRAIDLTSVPPGQEAGPGTALWDLGHKPGDPPTDWPQPGGPK